MVSAELALKLTEIAARQLAESSKYKQPRLERIKEYENAYTGKTRTKLRQTFNLPNLVFSGMVDTLESDFDDEIALKFEENDPADYNGVKKINLVWKQEASSLRPNARWNLKMRWDKHLAILYGRAIQKTYAESQPEYKSVFDVVDLNYFHFEPTGGGNLETHLFCGEEGIFKTREALEDGAKEGYYSKEQIDKIFEKSGDADYKPMLEKALGDKMNRFKAMGLDPAGFNYVGQEVYNLCEWGLTYKGIRYHLLFDAWTTEWVRCVELKDDFSSGLWPWTSWATHEDPKVFLSKSFADDLYTVGDAVKTLLDQELTNRQKRNLGAKGYDKAMFPDVAKLDAAQYRPDALVPVKVPEGKTIKDGIFLFETPELQGTINLVDWVERDLGKHAGVTEIQQAGAQKGKGANVQYTLLQQAQKRIGSKSKSYKECYTEIGLRYMYGLIDNLTEPIAIKIIGKDGYGWDELTRKDLRLKKPFDVKIVNQTEEDKMNVLGKDQKIAALKMILESEILIQHNNPKTLNEMIWRDVGGMSDEFITEVTDLENYGQKDTLAEADKAIQLLIKGKTPELFMDATTGFVQRIHRFERANQNRLGIEKSKLFLDYIEQMMPIVEENMNYQAGKIKAQNAMQGHPTGGEQPSPPGMPPQGQGQPQMPISRQQQAPMVSRPPSPTATAGVAM